MKILVFGANGATGKRLVAQSAVAGHEAYGVRTSGGFAATRWRHGACVRRRHRPRSGSGRCSDERSRCRSEHALRQAGRTRICAPGTQNIIDAMKASGVRRLVVPQFLRSVRDSRPGSLLRSRAVGFDQRADGRQGGDGGAHSIKRPGLDDHTRAGSAQTGAAAGVINCGQARRLRCGRTSHETTWRAQCFIWRPSGSQIGEAVTVLPV